MKISPLLSREQALHQLESALPQRTQYAAIRNYALDVPTTTLLSPFIRRRILEEEEILRAVLQGTAWNDVEKLVQEIVWRTYWKGWLENNPEVWIHYLSSLPRIIEGCTEEVAEGVNAVARGTSSLTCMNDWSNELSSTGYLHNHKRMWFASIWIFTLKLPWELGAKFFLERLLDGDPASNTLSWRWVAGLHTKGKCYLATPENIAKFTHQKWNLSPGILAFDGQEQRSYLGDSSGKYRTAQKGEPYCSSPLKTVLLVHAEDLRPETLPLDLAAISGVIIYRDISMPNHHPTDLLVEAVSSALDDLSLRVRALLPAVPTLETDDVFSIRDFINAHSFRRVVTPLIFQGFLRDKLDQVFSEMRRSEVVVQEVERTYDREFHPLARKGFFPFWEAAKKRILRMYTSH